MQGLGDIARQSTMVNRDKGFTNNGLSSIDNSKRVDMLVEDCSELIQPEFRLYFVKRFYKLSSDQVIKAFKLAHEGKEPARLFSYLIKRECGF